MSTLRQMPNSTEAEQALLGAILVYPNSMMIATEAGLEASQFYLESHRKIYTAMTMLQQEGKPIDMTTVTNRLTELNELTAVGGLDYILRLSETAVTSSNTKTYAELIQNKALARRLIETSQQIAEEGLTGQPNLDEYLDYAEKEILNVTRSRRTTDFRKGSDVIQIVLQNVEKMKEQGSRITGVATRFRDLDNTTNGFQPGDLILLAARPSVGKTALALGFALNVAMGYPDKAVAIFSLEMPAEQLIQRMLASKSKVEISKMRTGYLTGSEWNMLAAGANELRQTKLYIDDTSGIKVSEIFSKCRKLQAEQGLSMVVIDYIQLISGSSSRGSENRQQEVSEISRALKSLARELRIPVIALSQLSRSVETRDKNNRKPMLSDLRESGSLEQDADLVMLLYRDAYYNQEAKDLADQNEYEEIEINIAKHRNGPTREIKLAFEKKFNAFYDLQQD